MPVLAKELEVRAGQSYRIGLEPEPVPEPGPGPRPGPRPGTEHSSVLWPEAASKACLQALLGEVVFVREENFVSGAIHLLLENMGAYV